MQPFPACNLDGVFAADGIDLALQVADTRFAGIIPHNLARRNPVSTEPQSVLSGKTIKEMAAGMENEQQAA
jgi:hypothetical protein